MASTGSNHLTSLCRRPSIYNRSIAGAQSSSLFHVVSIEPHRFFLKHATRPESMFTSNFRLRGEPNLSIADFFQYPNSQSYSVSNRLNRVCQRTTLTRSRISLISLTDLFHLPVLNETDLNLCVPRTRRFIHRGINRRRRNCATLMPSLYTYISIVHINIRVNNMCMRVWANYNTAVAARRHTGAATSMDGKGLALRRSATCCSPVP